MDELIIDYIFDLCQVKGGVTIFFDGRKVYYDVLKKHLGDLFDLSEWEVDGYMITCFHDMDRDFDYSHFMNCLKPTPITLPSGHLFYMDFVYAGDRENRAIDWEAIQRNQRNHRYYGGIDPATLDGDITVGISSRAYGELSHPDSVDIINIINIRPITSITFNLELTPLDEDLDE